MAAFYPAAVNLRRVTLVPCAGTCRCAVGIPMCGWRATRLARVLPA